MLNQLERMIWYDLQNVRPYLYMVIMLLWLCPTKLGICQSETNITTHTTHAQLWTGQIYQQQQRHNSSRHYIKHFQAIGKYNTHTHTLSTLLKRNSLALSPIEVKYFVFSSFSIRFYHFLVVYTWLAAVAAVKVTFLLLFSLLLFFIFASVHQYYS